MTAAGTLGPGAETLLERACGGDQRALGRLITLLERGGADAEAVEALTAGAPPAWIIGLTGAPGAGKSTLAGRVATLACDAGQRVAVLMVDPSSPLSGGAILGDRLRIDDGLAERGVFVRSLATRGQGGGLSSTVPAALRLLERAGFDLVVVETAGVGQVEVAVARSADTTVVVVTPGWGDAIQANKAGLLELADLLVVNKGDRPGADDARRDLELMLDLGPSGGGAEWRPPVVVTAAADGRGVDDLWGAAGDHLAWLESSGRRAARRAEAIRSELHDRALALLGRRLDDQLATGAGEELVGAVAAGSLTPTAAAVRLAAPQPRRSTAQVKG